MIIDVGQSNRRYGKGFSISHISYAANSAYSAYSAYSDSFCHLLSKNISHCRSVGCSFISLFVFVFAVVFNYVFVFLFVFVSVLL